MRTPKFGKTEVSDAYKFRLSLSRERLANPEMVIREFLDNYQLNDLFTINRNWMFEALSYENGIYDDANERTNLMYYHEKLCNLLEAVYVLNGAHPDYKLPEHRKINAC